MFRLDLQILLHVGWVLCSCIVIYGGGVRHELVRVPRGEPELDKLYGRVILDMLRVASPPLYDEVV